MNIPLNFNSENIANETRKIDKKRAWWLLSPALPALGIGILAGYQFGPKKTKKIFALGGPILLHIVIPILDEIIGQDTSNPTEEDVKILQKDPYYKQIIKLFVPIQMLANIYAAYVVSHKDTSFLDSILLGMSIGAVNGIAVTTAHELCHRPSKLDHYLSHVTLMPLFYNHFRIEHAYGHHKRVATPEDPASSQMGESFYQFWPRTVFGSLKSSVEIENRRLKRKGLKFFSQENELFHGWIMSTIFHSSLITIFGKKTIPYLVTQAFYGITLFEIVNYIEHYGLLREKNSDGSYSRTLPEHSWNNNHTLTNLFLYQLQRHSDHHAFPTRPFQALRHFDGAPELPRGYATMLLPALIPSIWFKIMDKRIFHHYNSDISKANIHPKKRELILEKYKTPVIPSYAPT